MNEARTLLENFWICKDCDKETYYKVKRDIPNFQKFIREQLGWKLIHTENLLKLEKKPAHAQSFMGIEDFTDIRDYCILCVVLMYLEDKEEQEQFLLSELIDYVETQLKTYMEIDWTSFTQRKSLVRVMQYMERLQMLCVYEGSSEAFGREEGQEVLYENTGYSKYFATSFTTDISSYESWKDFEKIDFEELNEDRGTLRINRVYRQLAVCPAYYWEENDDADALYLKNQRQWVSKYLNDNLGGNLDIYKNAAFLTLEADDCYGMVHPRDAMLRQHRSLCEQELDIAQGNVISSIDQWIVKLFNAKKISEQWNPEEGLLNVVEEKIRQYQSVEDAGVVQELLRTDYERQRQTLTDARSDREYELNHQNEILMKTKEELRQLQNQEELEPEREESTRQTRAALQEAGIRAVPFYKTVEFAEKLSSVACARLEAQLQKMGIMDALIVSQQDFEKIRKSCPRFLDTVLYVEKKGNSHFSGLVVSETLGNEHREMVERILSNIFEKKGCGQGIFLGEDGSFRQGILAGRADKTGEAEFVGLLARKKRKEEKLRLLQEQVREYTKNVEDINEEIDKIKQCLVTLQEEYLGLPGFAAINDALAKEKDCNFALQRICERYNQEEIQERNFAQQKNEQYQIMLKQCKGFPYARTREAYDEVGDALEEYNRIWQNVRGNLVQLGTERMSCGHTEEQIAMAEQAMDDAFVEKRNCSTHVKACNVQIQQFEDYLNRPENIERANRLKELNTELEHLNKEYDDVKEDLAHLDERIQGLLESEPKQTEKLKQAIAEETFLRKYFEEELSLKLVVERGNRTLFECAKEAVGVIRENDKNRESSDMLNALYQVYQKYNGSLANYGTSLEECFGTVGDTSIETEMTNMLRKRVQVVSTWNGKKVYLEEFYGILKSAIEETELLIQKKDRELFEDILSQTISQQLTDRIEESRKWVLDMSKLMKDMDTSMGLSFSLEWKPLKAENDTELDTVELEQILLRDRSLLTMEDIEKVAAHFRSKIHTEKQKLEENGSVINYMEMVRDALDYRKWFGFQMYFRHGEEARKPLTNAAFNRFSGGEKAMAMYVPLFAAVNAQYQKAENKEHPRLIALDEAFAGVDDKNISSMFELVHKLDFDYIMNSQALWGCFETVKGLRIAELQRPQNSQTVSVIRYTWNGHERILDEQ